jgi:hypothetical protein
LKLVKEVTEPNPGEGTSAMYVEAVYVEAEKPKKAAPKPKVSIL